MYGPLGTMTSYLRDHSYNNILVGMLVVADGLEELHIVEMAVCVIFNVPLAAGAILGCTSALVVAAR